MKMKRGEGGVTLIEITVVMAIVVIMAFFLAPPLGEWLENYRIRQTARDISSTLQQAKIRAISTHLEYRVIFDVDNNTYKINKGNKSTDSDVWDVDDGVQPGDEVRKTSKNVDMVDASSEGYSDTADFIEFNPNSTANNDSIFLTNTQGKRYRIVVSRTGRIRMQGGWDIN